jgi:Uma2 family endonuclease
MRLIESQFYEFCRANRDLRIERTAEGDCEIMAPTGGETGWRNSRLITLLSVWADREGSGVVFDSSTGFVLPNGAIRSPDVSWVKRARLAGLTPEQRQRFLPLCPDFVIELCSPSDNLTILQDKMQEYMHNGACLGWLIEPEARQVYIFRPKQAVSRLDNPQSVNGDEKLPGFELELRKVWDVDF